MRGCSRLRRENPTWWKNKCTPAQKIINSDNNGDGGSATQEVLTRWRFRGQQYPSLQVREALSRLWYSLGFTNCDLARFLHTSPTRGSAESTSHAHLHIFITTNRCSLFSELYRKLELLRKLPALGRDPDLLLLGPVLTLCAVHVCKWRIVPADLTQPRDVLPPRGGQVSGSP